MVAVLTQAVFHNPNSVGTSIGIVAGITAAMSQSVALIAVAGLMVFGGVALAIVLLVFYCLPGTRGPNRFGEDPLGHSAEQLAATFN